MTVVKFRLNGNMKLQFKNTRKWIDVPYRYTLLNHLQAIVLLRQMGYDLVDCDWNGQGILQIDYMTGEQIK